MDGHTHTPPLHGSRCWLCWARYAWMTSHSPLSRLMGKAILRTWLQGLTMRRMPRTRFRLSSKDSLVLMSSTSLSSTMAAPLSKKPSTILKKFGSSFSSLMLRLLQCLGEQDSLVGRRDARTFWTQVTTRGYMTILLSVWDSSRVVFFFLPFLISWRQSKRFLCARLMFYSQPCTLSFFF